MTTLLHTKKAFMDNYGEVPPMIGFLGVDTDGGAYKRTLESKNGDEVRILPNEQLPIQVENAQPIFEVDRDRFTWLPEQNAGALTSMMLGAGQVRTNGRFAFTVNYDKVKTQITRCLNDISRAEDAQNAQWEILGGANVEIHMVFSLAGGTGCGTFLNMAYLLKEVAPQCKLMGYGVLPDVFEAMSASTMAKVKPNAYGAVQDLDWFMHLDMAKEPFELLYRKSSQLIKGRPFNSFVFIDNKNKEGDIYDHVDKLAEMVSLALVTSAGALSEANASVNDNLEKIIREGDMDVETKKAWAAGMGASEIVFRGADLSRIYAIKTSNYIIENLLNSCVDTDSIVNNWIDKPEVNIRENNGMDNLIDYLMPKNPKFPMAEINDPENAESEVFTFVASSMPKDEDVMRRSAEKQERVRTELHRLIVAQTNRNCGVGAAEKVIMGLKAQIDVMLGEMRSERDEFSEKAPRIEQSLKAQANELAEYNGKFFKSKGKLEERKQDLIGTGNVLAVCRREVKRREFAIQFYTFVNNLLMEESDHVAALRKKLESVYHDNTQRLAEIQNRVGGDHQMFQIDLAQDYVTKIAIATEEINLNDFIASIPEGDRLYAIGVKSNSEVSDYLMNYAKGLTGARKWESMSINDIFNEMDEDTFKALGVKAIRKSMPLLTYNYQGYSPEREPIDIYYLGVPSKDCRFNKLFLQENCQGAAEVDESVIGMKDRVILYRQIGIVPAYAISSVPTYRGKYETCKTNCHIDVGLQNRMKREEYSLTPKRAIDNTVELWVKGLIFGLVKNENGHYYYKDTVDGDPLLDYWVELPAYRDDAFNQFRRNRSTLEDQFEQFFDKLQQEKGTDFLQVRVAEAKEGQNYLNRISQINMSVEEIRKRGNEGVRKLIEDEINFVKKSL